MKISFRYKIQAGVLVILVTTLTVYIFLAGRTLKGEKTASLMESSASNCELVADRVGRKIATSLTWLESAVIKSQVNKVMIYADNAELLWAARDTTKGREQMFQSATLKYVPPAPTKFADETLTMIPEKDGKSVWLAKRYLDGSRLVSLWSVSLFTSDMSNFPDTLVYLVNSESQVAVPLNGVALKQTEITEGLPKLIQTKALTSREERIGKQEMIFASSPLETPNNALVIGVPKELAMVPVYELQRKSLYFAIGVFGVTGLLAYLFGSGLTRRLMNLVEQTSAIAKGDLESAKQIDSNDEIGELSTSIVKMSHDLKRYVGEVSEKSRMEAELQTARTVQETLFPEVRWENEQYEIQGFYQSASECGGDFWYYWRTQNYLFFFLGDATGHGAPAALITSATRSAIAGIEFREETELADITELLDHSIRASSKGRILMTGFAGKLNLSTGMLEYINCSHEPGFMLSVGNAGFPDLIAQPVNPRLGDEAKKHQFTSGVLQIQPGDTLYLYTDGLSETHNAAGVMLSERRFVKIITANLAFDKGIDLAPAIQQILKTVRDYSEGTPQADDITMLAVRAKTTGFDPGSMGVEF